MNMNIRPLAPRMRQLPPRRSAILSVLDVGTSKVVCLIAKLYPAEPSEMLKGRTHRCRILGIGHQRSRGIKGGAVIDMQEAESAIRLALDAAERMAGVQVESVIVNVTGGRLSSQLYHTQIGIGGRAVSEQDIHKVLEVCSQQTARPDRAVLHSLPTGFSLDATRFIRDPKGMIGDTLGTDMHVLSCDQAAARNLMLVVERCHLGIEAMVATPYAAGLAALVDDEAELGTILIDMGGGTTSLAIFSGGALTHVDAFAVGGQHITMDIARGLNIRLADAERLKTLHGSCYASESDEREILTISQANEDQDQPSHLPRAQFIRIIKPRVEEILELVRDRLKNSGFPAHSGRRIVLTGGASQLTGLPELAKKIILGQVRIGRPLGMQGLPESAKSPAFAASLGLLVYPQVSGLEHYRPSRQQAQGQKADGYMVRMGRWLKSSF